MGNDHQETEDLIRKAMFEMIERYCLDADQQFLVDVAKLAVDVEVKKVMDSFKK